MEEVDGHSKSYYDKTWQEVYDALGNARLVFVKEHYEDTLGYNNSMRALPVANCTINSPDSSEYAAFDADGTQYKADDANGFLYVPHVQ